MPTNADASVSPRRTLRVLLLSLAALTAFAVSAPSASAHAELTSVTPADKATVDAPPTEVVLTFNEDLLAPTVKVAVTDAEGVPVGDGAPVVEGQSATLKLGDGLAAGGYSITYRVVSKDGHPISGSTTFTVQAAGGTTSATAGTTTDGATSSSPSETSEPATTSSATAAATDASEPTSGGSNTGLFVGLGALALAAVVGVLLLARRRTQDGRHID